MTEAEVDTKQVCKNSLLPGILLFTCVPIFAVLAIMFYIKTWSWWFGPFLEGLRFDDPYTGGGLLANSVVWPVITFAIFAAFPFLCAVLLFVAMMFFSGRDSSTTRSGDSVEKDQASAVLPEEQAFQAAEEEEALRQLRKASKLEARGRIEEALRTYDEIIEQYPDTPACKDARVSRDGLKKGTQ